VKPIRILALAAALALPLVAFAAQPAKFSPDRFRAHVAFLADDLLEGREAGTRGHEIAARYVASQFEQMGLAPAGDSGGWYEEVDLAETAPAGPAPTLTVTNAKTSKTFENGQAVAVRGSADGGAVEVDAPAVFVGYGLTDPVTGIDDYKDLDVRGKVVVYVRAGLLSADSEIAAHQRADQARNASAHGAAATITVFTRAAQRVNAWRQLAAQAAAPASGWVDKQGHVHGGTQAMKAVANVDLEPAQMLFEGAPMSFDQVLDELAAGRRPRGFALTASVHIKAETKVRRYRSPEVIGLIRGSDPALRDQYVVLMAHLDHLGIRPGRPDPIYNGALDNAAGVATLLEVGHALTTDKTAPRRSVLLIANTAEEKGLLGAEYFARYPTVPAGAIVAAVDMDQPVLTYAFTDVVAFGGTHSTLDRSIRKAASAMHVALAPDFMPEQGVFVRSDHYPLARAGVPAVMLVVGPSNGGKAAWDNFMSERYHRPNDDLSQPILWVQGARFAELNYRVVRELADTRTRPLWYEGDYFGDLFAPDQPKARR
jgi:hypothetical protein